MKAEEAQQIVKTVKSVEKEARKDQILNNIIKEIRVVAEEGRYITEYELDGFGVRYLGDAQKAVINELIQLGYQTLHTSKETERGTEYVLRVLW